MLKKPFPIIWGFLIIAAAALIASCTGGAAIPMEESSPSSAAASTTLSTSVSNLGLSVNNTALNAALTGNPRIITITNTGTSTATSVTYSTTPAFPAGTTISPASCGNIAAGGSCSLTITPGGTESAPAGNTSPTPVALSIQGTNTNTVTSNIHVVTYGSFYQSGFIFAIDDTTTNTGSIGGKAITQADQAPSGAGVIWSSNGAGSANGDTAYDNVTGISEVAVPGAGSCAGKSDGSCNSNLIVAFYPAVNLNFYSSGLCKATIGGRNDWYLPSICELGYDGGGNGSGCGTVGAPNLQNIQSNLVAPGIVALNGNYYSSTQSSAFFINVWIQFFANVNPLQMTIGKNNDTGTRCARALTL